MTAQAFHDAVQRATEGTPYVVTRTEEGFDVTLDIVDAQWYGVFNKAGLKKVYTHHVLVPGDGTYTVVDDAREVEWVAGTPRVAASSERIHGRVKEFGAQKVWAFDEQGRFARVVDFRFNSEEGRELITEVAERLGLHQKRGGAEKIGLAMAGIAVGGLVVAGIVVLTLLLLGKLPS